MTAVLLVDAGYSFPAPALATPLISLARNPGFGSAYAFLALAALTVLAATILRRSARTTNGN
jgi:membrane protein implicated in regulation of membrane protease activity